MPTDASAGDGDDLPAEVPQDELTFTAHDLGRGRVPVKPVEDLGFAPAKRAEEPPADGFVIREPQGVAPAAPAVQPSADQLWTTREPAPEPAPTPTWRRGWTTRHTELVDRSAHATMLRLREEAVNVSWKAAWIAVTSADRRLLRKRDF